MKKLAFVLAIIAFGFQANSQTVGIKILTNGDVGIGTATPVEQLDVDGAIKLGTTTATNAGTIRYNPSNCDFEGYDGSNWISLTGGAANCNGTPPPPPVPTCSDGIQNQGETGVDCGGPCAPCGGGGGGSCESFPDQNLVRDLPNVGYANEYNVGGTGISGDGELCWKVNPHVGNTQGCLGFSDAPTANAALSSIDYGFFFYIRATNNMYRVYVRENGANRGLFINQNTDVNNMVFCIRRTGSTVEYLIDGNLVYTSNVSNSNHLYFDNSHYDHPASPVWGVRPASAHYYDIEICPNGTYTATSPDNTPAVGIQDEENDARINALESQVESLISMIRDEQPIDISGLDVAHSQVQLTMEDKAALNQNKPNPFSHTTLIRYYIPDNVSKAEMVFYDMNGRPINSIILDQTGFGEVSVDAQDLPNGLYSYRLVLDGEVMEAKKMNIMR